MKGKSAIEKVSEQPLNQSIKERKEWKFQRIASSDYYFDEKQAKIFPKKNISLSH